MEKELMKCYKEIKTHELLDDSFQYYTKHFAIMKIKINKKIESLVNKISRLKRNKIIILSGYPGSGKSTVTGMLNKIGYKILSLDDKIGSYHELNELTKLEVRKKTNHIVLDGTFMKQKEINYFKWVNDIKYYDLLHIHMDVPIHYAYFNNVNRCLDRRNKRKLLPFKVYKMMEKNNNVVFPHKGVNVISYG